VRLCQVAAQALTEAEGEDVGEGAGGVEGEVELESAEDAEEPGCQRPQGGAYLQAGGREGGRREGGGGERWREWGRGEGDSSV